MADFYYTVVPPQMAVNEQKEAAECHLVCYKGVAMYVRAYDAQHYQVVSLCTTNPAYYLKKELAPGSLIPLFS